jgi:putative Holliday junction resolvase
MLNNNLSEFKNLIGSSGILISIDYGARKIGLSISSENRSMALPLAVIANDSKVFTEIINYITHKKAVGIIIGHPVNMDGSLSQSSSAVEKFANQLIKKTSLPVYFQDERRTSKAADSLLRIAGFNRKDRNQLDDSVAASLILESTLSQLKQLESF